MKAKRLPVSASMMAEFHATDAADEFLRNAEFDVDEGMIEEAIQDVAEERWSASDAIENLISGPFGEENAANLLHADPAYAQAILRCHFIRACAGKVAARIETNYMQACEESRIDAAEYAAEAARDSAEARLARSAA